MPVHPVVLDFDGSVLPLHDERRVALHDWQDAVRHCCSHATMRRLGAVLDRALPRRHGAVFLGSGDFHHVTLELVRRNGAGDPVDVIVFDNHPDNMRFAFGVHCGSWVRHVALLPCVATVNVLGITSRDASTAQAWQNYLTPLLRGRLAYWCIGVDIAWARRLRLAARVQSFATADAMLERFIEHQRGRSNRIYLSIDKDVLAPDEVRTNWDQGKLAGDQLVGALMALRGRVIGADVTGEVSAHRHRRLWKRMLSALDRQPHVEPDRLPAWQRRQYAMNVRILHALDAAWCAPGRDSMRQPETGAPV